MKSFASFLASAVLVAPFSGIALAEEAPTQGPGARLYKLPDRWVSILPKSEQDVAAEKAKAEEAQKAAEAAKLAEAQKAAADQKAVTDAAAAAPLVAVVAPTAPAAVAPVAKTNGLAGYTPDANYSGACHVTVRLDKKTYVVNPSSSTDMVLAAPENAVCLPTEKLAIRYGFKKTVR